MLTHFRQMRAISRHLSTCILAVLLFTSMGTDALKVALVPMNANSPALDLMAVGAKLVERGHQVAVVVAEQSVDYMKRAAARHSSNTTGEAIQYIPLDIGLPAVEGATKDLARMKKSMMDKYAAPTGLWQSLMIGPRMLYLMRGYVAAPCKHVLSNPQTFQALKEFAPDAVLAVSIPITAAGVSDSCGCMIAHALHTTFIDVFWSPLSSVDHNQPQYTSGLSPADLHQPLLYAKNLAMWAIQRVALPLWEAVYPDNMAVVRKDLGLPQAEAQCVAKRFLDHVRGAPTQRCTSLKEIQLYNWLLEYPTTLKQNQVLVGSGTPRPARPIQPAEVAAFVDSAPAGVALVAFGSTVQSAALLEPEDVTALAAAFNGLSPMRVLIAMGDSHLPAGMTVKDLRLQDNAMMVPWVDYNDVLGHRNTRIIISHGGGHSVHEAAFHGVPMLAIPFMYDSAVEYAQKYIARGAGVMCYQAPVFRRDTPNMRYTKHHLLELINKVLTDPSYTAAAKAISLGLQTYAKHRHPYERAADEIELALYTHYAQQGRAVQAVLPESMRDSSSTKAAAIDGASRQCNTASSSSGPALGPADSNSCDEREYAVQHQDQTVAQPQHQDKL